MPERHNRNKVAQAAVDVPLSVWDVQTLLDLSNHYERAMGPVRHVVRLTAGRTIRAKFRFVHEESLWLGRFAESTLAELQAAPTPEVNVAFTCRALLAFWGRILASLESRRSRRKLSSEEVEHRERLARKLEDAAHTLGRVDRKALDRELATRRPAEAQHIRARLGL